ncbi:MAG TPA: lipocalin family protein [Chitinophagaceae bacterium]|jgi:hypothetical protein|nr:lipocalin family protein [Chitinophagaceae bacterium]
MKRLNLIVPFSLLVSFFFFACDKSSDNPPPKTKTELLAQSSWKFDNAKVGGIDVSSALQACQKDNILVFAATLTGTVDEGPLKCNTNDPQTTSFTWNFASNETVLHVSTVLFTGGSSDFNIVSLTDTQLILSQNINVSGTTQNAVVTFKH